MHKVDILGVPFACLTQAEAVEKIFGYLKENHNHIIVTPNPEGVMQARRNPAFYEALYSADLSLADGTGIVIASVFLQDGQTHRRLPERVRGVDTMFALLEKTCESKRETTAYFLGGAAGVAEKAKQNIESRYSNFKVVGTHDGFFTAEQEPDIVAEINDLSPDILLVCTGMPRAELWATKNRNINARVTMCLGGTIDIMAGTVKLAPPLMRKLGLEWLNRLFRQPQRFFRMLDIPRFMWAVLVKKVLG
ncbi:MAG: WecB/TagA/CpsF family glycosyltransferase [Defluviitaleaceae bacterium]|nr:WecB/TagA/CpsF family glycosyltransferase [Defluviitaleaceae bacterium]